MTSKEKDATILASGKREKGMKSKKLLALLLCMGLMGAFGACEGNMDSILNSLPSSEQSADVSMGDIVLDNYEIFIDRANFDKTMLSKPQWDAALYALYDSTNVTEIEYKYREDKGYAVAEQGIFEDVTARKFDENRLLQLKKDLKGRNADEETYFERIRGEKFISKKRDANGQWTDGTETAMPTVFTLEDWSRLYNQLTFDETTGLYSAEDIALDGITAKTGSVQFSFVDGKLHYYAFDGKDSTQAPIKQAYVWFDFGKTSVNSLTGNPVYKGYTQTEWDGYMNEMLNGEYYFLSHSFNKQVEYGWGAIDGISSQVGKTTRCDYFVEYMGLPSSGGANWRYYKKTDSGIDVKEHRFRTDEVIESTLPADSILFGSALIQSELSFMKDIFPLLTYDLRTDLYIGRNVTITRNGEARLYTRVEVSFWPYDMYGNPLEGVMDRLYMYYNEGEDEMRECYGYSDNPEEKEVEM